MFFLLAKICSITRFGEVYLAILVKFLSACLEDLRSRKTTDDSVWDKHDQEETFIQYFFVPIKLLQIHQSTTLFSCARHNRNYYSVIDLSYLKLCNQVRTWPKQDRMSTGDNCKDINPKCVPRFADHQLFPLLDPANIYTVQSYGAKNFWEHFPQLCVEFQAWRRQLGNMFRTTPYF